jgi:hypothetical protein
MASEADTGCDGAGGAHDLNSNHRIERESSLEFRSVFSVDFPYRSKTGCVLVA